MKTAIDIQIRPYRGEEDVPKFVNILNAELAFDQIPNRESAEDTLAWVRHPSKGFDASRDLSIAEIDGQMVGYSQRQWVDTSDGLREYGLNGAVLPEFRRRGVGTALLRENEQRQRELAGTHDTDRPKVFGSWSSDRQAGRIALLRENG